MNHEFKVNIDAPTSTQAKEILIATLQLMKAVRSRTTDKEYIRIAIKIADKPSFIDKAKFFI